MKMYFVIILQRLMSESCFSKQGIGVPGGTGILAM
jgi:hypothetical protein